MSTISAAGNPGTALFGTARRRVLALLFGHPQQAYYLRQAARLTRLGLGAAQRELNRLSASGVLRRTVEGRQVYFQAEEACPVFEELKSLVAKTSGARTTLRAALWPLRERIRAAFLYGSFAEGREGPASDVDLMVVGDVGFDDLVAAIVPAEEILGREVNPTLYPLSEFRAKCCAGHHFLASVMRGPKLFLLGDNVELARLGARRVDHRAPHQRGRDSKPPRHR